MIFSFVFLFTKVNASTCPYGIENDPYPWQCTIYVDKDADGFCDHGQEWGFVPVEELVETPVIVNNVHLEWNHECKWEHPPVISFVRHIHLWMLFAIIALLIIFQFISKKFEFNKLKIVDILSYIVFPVAALFWVYYAMYMQLDLWFLFDAWISIWYLCLWLFFIIMFVKPISVLIEWPKNVLRNFSIFVMQFRRPLWILVFWLAFAHTLVYVLYVIANNIVISEFFIPWALIAWIIWIVALLIGFLTSNDFSIRLLKKHWKPIQMLAYPALLWSIVHIIFIAPDRGYALLWLFVVYCVLKVLEIRNK